MVVIFSKIYEEDFEQKVLKSDKPVLVDFYADWCAPCKMLSTVLEEIAGENPDFNFFKTNIDENPQLASAFGINAIPAVLIFKNGELAETMIGYNQKQTIQEIINKTR